MSADLPPRHVRLLARLMARQWLARFKPERHELAACNDDWIDFGGVPA